MEHFRSVTSRSNRSREMSDNGQSHASSTYQAKSDGPSFKTQGMPSDVPSSDTSDNRSFIEAHKSNKNIRLIPLKVKDAMRLLQTNPEYMGKSPVKLNINENSIDKIMQQQHGNNYKLSPNSSFRRSPMSSEREYSGEQLERTIEAQEPPNPPLGEAQTQQVFAMHDIQAYPMIGESGFRAGASGTRGRSRVRRLPQPRIHHSRPRKEVRYGRTGRSPKRNRSRARRRPVSRSRRSRSRPRKVVRIRRPKSVVTVQRQPRLYNTCCTPFPMCENDCYPTGGSYYPSYTSYPPNRYGPDITQSRIDMACSCNLCQEKLQFIQPGVCPKKKHMWTNEYAIIPKPQVNLIDPCDELDPSIYPRADNPCIRDSHGNPLTDCIGRPLRDPIGKRMLKFGANGSVMDTNFRGNFYTGQPPLCVKCPMPDRSSCAPDTTHNYWMSCGYPIMPNMNSYFQHVVANENIRR